MNKFFVIVYSRQDLGVLGFCETSVLHLGPFPNKDAAEAFKALLESMNDNKTTIFEVCDW